MGMGDVMEVFENNPNRWYTSNELVKILGLSHTAICVTLKKLRVHGEIEYIDRKKRKECFLYRYKE